jgi:hypothetical protein
VPTVAAQGIDLNNFSISGFAFRAPGGAWKVTGAGNETANSIVTGALAVDTALAADAIITLRAATVDQWKIYREATTNRFIVLDETNAAAAFATNPATGLVTVGEGASAVQISSTGGVTMAGLPTSAGGGGLFVCVDTAGVLYKKATCP